MSALARHLLALGYTVSGSDCASTLLTTELNNAGIDVHIGHDSNNIASGCNIVVYSSAVPADNVELVEARRQHIPVILREQLLGQIFNSYRQRIAICGTHGKTTTTSMLDYVFRRIGIRHTSFIGGMPLDTHNNYSQGDNVVIAEACEYRESFVYLFPSIIIALNIEWDHPDYYKSFEQMCDSYYRFFGNMDRGGTIVANGDNIPASLLLVHNYITFGLQPNNTYYADNLTVTDGKYSYDLCHRQQTIATIQLNILGKHNVYNSLAVITCCILLGMDVEIVCKILSDYRGTERRWQVMCSGRYNCVADYAHHPTEIRAVIATARQLHYDRVIVLFQPHTYSRTQALWRDFVTALSQADFVGMLPIYSAREKPIEGVSSRLMCNSINKYTDCTARLLEDFEEALQYVVDNTTSRDLILVMGAGDIIQLATMISDQVQ